MDLNAFIFRDDTAERLDAGTDDADAFDSPAEPAGFVTPAKVALAALGSAVLGMSHLLGHAGKHL
ncbi:MAG TPA: hypothetical protein VEC60_10555 [Reyranella sp.]|nr:hypothetical protein [Reyranella sp.]